MISLLTVSLLTATGQLSIDGNLLTLTSAEQRTVAIDTDIVTFTVSATHPQEFDAAFKSANDAEERVQTLLKKEEGATMRLVSSQATANPAGPTPGPLGGTITRVFEVRMPTSARFQALVARLTSVRGVTGLSISHDVSDRKKALSQARKEAIEGARAKADDYASAIGRKLGKVIMLTENGEGVQAPYASMALVISTNVTLKFNLE